MKPRTMAKKLSTKESDDKSHRFHTRVDIYRTHSNVELDLRLEELQEMVDAISFVLKERHSGMPDPAIST